MDLQRVSQVFQPCAALQPFVSMYTTAYLSAGEPILRIQPAHPHQFLIFYPNEVHRYSYDGNTFNKLPQTLVIGPFTKPVRLVIPPLQLTIIANLFPGALHRLCHLSMHEILNEPLDGIEAFGNEIKTVNEQLGEAKTHTEMILQIEAFLLKKIHKVKDILPIDQTCRLLISSPTEYTIEQLASLSCVSLRQFERQFLNRIGTTPTMFIRQARIREALRLKRIHPELNWTAIAHQCGYYDQMHFIRDFKLFTGATPTAFQYFLPVNAPARA